MKTIKSVFLVIITAIFIAGCSNNTFTDKRDGKVYKTVKIGNQVWMAENLAYKPDNGNYWAYDENESNVAVYGYLYDWETACDVCPAGWHLPSDDEWKELEMYLGMSQEEVDEWGWRGTDEGGKLKEVGTTFWAEPNEGATNTSGFSGLPGGYRHTNGSFYYTGRFGYFWSSSVSGSEAWVRELYYDNAQVYRHDSLQSYGFSARCLKD